MLTMFSTENHLNQLTATSTGNQIQSISDLGHNPDNWLEVLNHYLRLQDGPTKRKLLKHFFLRVQEEIDMQQQKYSLSYAKILAHEAAFIGESDKDEARAVFKRASLNLRRVPYIHIAFAQFELDQGRREKAIKILQRSEMIVSSVKDIKDALTRIGNGYVDLLPENKAQPPLRNVTNTSFLNNIPENYDDTTNSYGVPQAFPSSQPELKMLSPRKHTIAEALDLPSSPCTPELDERTKPGLKTSSQDHHNFKTPVLPKRQTNANFNVQRLKSPTPFGSLRKHAIAEVLDLPSSPCTPELYKRTKPGLVNLSQSNHSFKTPDLPKGHTSNNTAFNILSLKSPTPPRLSYSLTGTFPKPQATNSFKNNNLTNELSARMSTVTKTKKEKSESKFGKPRRVLRVQEKTKDSDEEMDGIERIDPSESNEISISGSKPPESNSSFGSKPTKPFPIQENVLKFDDVKNPSLNSHHFPPHPRIPHQQSSAQELQDWVQKSKLLKVHHQTYRIMRELGVGGSSKVYEVLDLSTDTMKAMKQVALAGCDNSVREGYLNEIKFLVKLKGSSNIIRLFDYELIGDHLCIVMECGSTDLAKLLRQHKSVNAKLETYEIWYFWKQMLAAVKTIHDHGVIHLDLKPANFLIVRGNLKLIDFGIANAIQDDATSVIKETQFGTLNYMAPETILDMSGYQTNARKFKISPRADVWSLGCILYLMMYGNTPFQHITHQLMKLNAITNPACQLEFDDFPDRQLLATVQQCLQRDPKKRPTVQQLLHG